MNLWSRALFAEVYTSEQRGVVVVRNDEIAVVVVQFLCYCILGVYYSILG